MKTRLQYIVNNEGLSNNRFAAEIGISPAAVTHIISGRNNPSLEIISKIASHYPKYNLRWLILGELPILTADIEPLEAPTDHSQHETKTSAEPSIEPQRSFAFDSNSTVSQAPNICKEVNTRETNLDNSNSSPNILKDNAEHHCSRIMVCLPDGTFQEYVRRNH